MAEDEQDNRAAKLDILGRQLTELNNRSRWYSTQLWTVPFTYLGVSAIILMGFLKEASEHLWIALIACGLIGVFVVWHLKGIQDGEKRAVNALMELEKQIGLPTAKYTRICESPLIAAVWVFTVLFFLLGVLLVRCQFC